MGTRLAIATASALLLATAAAHAQDKQACLNAYDRAQQLRSDAKLRAAREQLLLCTRPECPALVRQDCSQWMGEVTSSLPSVVIASRDAAGHDVLNVRVTIDNVVVAEQLDGKPIPVDPGPHKFKYETPGMAPLEEQVLVREGERNRPLTVTFIAASDTSSGAGDKPSRFEADGGANHQEKQGPPIVPYTLIGLGVVGLGAALFFDLKATGDAHNLRDGCAPACKPEDVDAVRSKYVAAGVSLGVGIVGVGLGTVLLLTRPSSAKTASSWSLDVAPASGGATSRLRVTF